MLEEVLEADHLPAVLGLLKIPSLDVNVHSTAGKSVFYIAVESDHDELLVATIHHPLFDYSASWGGRQDSALHLAVSRSKRHFYIIVVIITFSVSVDVSFLS